MGRRGGDNGPVQRRRFVVMALSLERDSAIEYILHRCVKDPVKAPSLGGNRADGLAFGLSAPHESGGGFIDGMTHMQHHPIVLGDHLADHQRW